MTQAPSKRVAIMQPYFIPYLGYFQLIAAVDCFVIYDDVQYMVGGWINRNRILDPGKEWRYLNVQLSGSSPNKLIHEVDVDPNARWRRKVVGTLRGTYGRSPFAKELMPAIEEMIQFPAAGLADFLTNSLQVLSRILGIDTEIIPTSRKYDNTELGRMERIVDICGREGSTHYINAIGGKELYGKGEFADAGVKLSFLEPDLSLSEDMALAQVQGTDLGLSVIHLLFQYGPEACHHLVHRGKIV
ncbi:MAG: WbqC family protein [Lewinella sp.]|nr:WbqC family protein [Lewinella sp.]